MYPSHSVPFRLIPSHSVLFRPIPSHSGPLGPFVGPSAAVGSPQPLAERAKEWTEQGLREGREQGIEQGLEQGPERGRAEERALPCRQAGRKFDAETAERLSGLLERLSHPERLAEVGDRIIGCRTGAELLDHTGRISRLS